MNNLIIKPASVVIITGKTNRCEKAKIPFYLVSEPSFTDSGAMYCTIDLRNSQTSALRMTFEPGNVLRHTSGAYVIQKVERHSKAPNPLITATPVFLSGLSDSEIITACVQLTDISEISKVPATITGMSTRSGNRLSREVGMKCINLSGDSDFKTVVILDKPCRYFRTTYMDIHICSLETPYAKCFGLMKGHTIRTGRKQLPIILASSLKGGNVE